MENLLEELEKQEGEKTEGLKFDFSEAETDSGAGAEDIFSQFDNGGFFGDEDEQEEDNPGKNEKEARQDFYKAAARQYVATFDAVVPKLASLYSRGPSENYKFSQEDREEYETVTAAFFESIEWHPDPKAMFLGFTGMLCVVIYLKAADDKKRIEAERRATEAAKKWKTAKTEEERAQANFEMKEASQHTGKTLRQRFSIDNDGFYERSVTGKYLKKEDRTEKPAPEVRELIRKYEFFTDGTPRSQGQINAAIRAELYGEE